MFASALSKPTKRLFQVFRIPPNPINVPLISIDRKFSTNSGTETQADKKREFTERDIIDIVVRGTAKLVKEDESKCVYFRRQEKDEQYTEVNSMAIQLRKAFKQVQNKEMSVIAHERHHLCDESCIRVEGQCVHVIPARQHFSITGDREEVKNFMREEFGWAAIENINIFREVTEVKLHRKFPVNWNVLVFDSFTNFSIGDRGVMWKKNNLRIFCLLIP